jgi:hypothetical protein
VRNTLLTLGLALALGGVLAAPAEANTITVGAKVTKTQAAHVHHGTLLVFPGRHSPNYYPSESSPPSPPPVACAWYLDGMGMFWGGGHWSCQCLAKAGPCEWVLDYIDQDGYPPGYVDRPPSGVCYIG